MCKCHNCLTYFPKVYNVDVHKLGHLLASSVSFFQGDRLAALVGVIGEMLHLRLYKCLYIELNGQILAEVNHCRLAHQFFIDFSHHNALCRSFVKTPVLH